MIGTDFSDEKLATTGTNLWKSTFESIGKTILFIYQSNDRGMADLIKQDNTTTQCLMHAFGADPWVNATKTVKTI